MDRARHEGARAPSVGQRAKLTRAPSGDGGRQAPQRAGTAKRPEEAPGAPAEPGRLRRSQDNRLSDDSPRGGVQAAEAEAGGVVLGVGVGVGHDVSDELEVPGAAPAPQGGRGAGASAHHREAGTWNLQIVGYVVPDADPDTERNPTGFRFSRLDASTW